MEEKIWVRQSDGSYKLVDRGCQWDDCEPYENNDGYMTSAPRVEE